MQLLSLKRPICLLLQSPNLAALPAALLSSNGVLPPRAEQLVFNSGFQSCPSTAAALGQEPVQLNFTSTVIFIYQYLARCVTELRFFSRFTINCNLLVSVALLMNELGGLMSIFAVSVVTFLTQNIHRLSQLRDFF